LENEGFSDDFVVEFSRSEVEIWRDGRPAVLVFSTDWSSGSGDAYWVLSQLPLFYSSSLGSHAILAENGSDRDESTKVFSLEIYSYKPRKN
jgi:hypothetical protein